MMKTLAIILLIILPAWQSSRQVDVADGFETGTVSSIWGTWRFLPGAVEFQSACVRSGKRAIEITLRPGDQMADEKTTVLERAELTESSKLVSLEDSAYEYSFSLFLPRDFPVVPTRLVIAQWKQYCASGDCAIDNPVIALRYESGEFRVTLKTQPKTVTLYSQSEDIRGQWLDFRFRICFSRTRNGHVSASLNNRRIIDYTGTTAYSEDYGYPAPGYFYFKMGLYRDHMELPMTIYIDDYRKEQISGDPQ